MTGRIRLRVENGYLLDVPVYNSHKRARNWLAVIQLDPAFPGGLKRSFSKAGRGDYYYSIEELEVGAPVEFGADYYTGSGRKRANRWYGVVIDIGPTYVELVGPFSTPRDAVEYSKQWLAEQKEVTKGNLLEEIIMELEKMSEKQLENVLNYIRSILNEKIK